MSRSVVVLSAVRSAIGGFNGTLANFEPGVLAGLVMKEAFVRAGVDAKQVTHATIGNVIPTNERYPYQARVACIEAGMSMDSTVMSVNRLCSSGLQGIITTSQNIMLGDAEIGVGGGVEVMSAGGYMSTSLRSGARMGDSKMVDMMVAVLTDPFGAGHMGCTAENLATKWKISREEQDAFAHESQVRAANAIAAGHFRSQIVPITIKDKKGDKVFDTDEHPRKVGVDKLAAMKPAFAKVGTVTAGNASGINDGASFLVLAEANAAQRLGRKPLARLVSYAVHGVEAKFMGEGPIPATLAALKKANLTLDQMDVIESNEAFAAQAIAVNKGLGLDVKKTNPNGGAIALGHPVGATGAVIATKAIHELQRTNGRYALVTMCIGGGQGIAAIFERI